MARDVWTMADYEEAFEHESMRFRISGTKKQFVRYMQGRRAPFGHVESRKFIGAASMRRWSACRMALRKRFIQKHIRKQISRVPERVNSDR